LRRRAKKRRRRGIVDTSVLVAGISGFKESYVPGKFASADVLHRWAQEGNFLWLITEEILEEYKEILMRRRVRPRIIGEIINLLREEAENVKVRSSVELSSDPDDNPFCFCSEQGKADFIVTLNPKDFPEDRLKARVVAPEQLLRNT
jgi:uncharacterized protein